jgi:hypothetical protein
MNVSGQLRRAARRAGSVYRVAKDSGVSQPALQRFVNGGATLSMVNVDRLAAYLELELKPTTKGGPQR